MGGGDSRICSFSHCPEDASSRSQMLRRRHLQAQGSREEGYRLHPKQRQELLQMQELAMVHLLHVGRLRECKNPQEEGGGGETQDDGRGFREAASGPPSQGRRQRERAEDQRGSQSESGGDQGGSREGIGSFRIYRQRDQGLGPKGSGGGGRARGLRARHRRRENAADRRLEVRQRGHGG